MKTKFFILLTFAFFALNGISQEHPKITLDDILAKKWEFIMEKTRLNQTDVNKVQPLFVEYESEVWKLFEKNKEIFRGFKNIKQGESINYESINDAIVNFEIEKAQLQKRYYLKLKKSVSPLTINKLLNAERIFRKDMIQKFPFHSPNNQERQRLHQKN